jgi:hypothetical protein
MLTASLGPAASQCIRDRDAAHGGDPRASLRVRALPHEEIADNFWPVDGLPRRSEERMLGASDTARPIDGQPAHAPFRG